MIYRGFMEPVRMRFPFSSFDPLGKSFNKIETSYLKMSYDWGISLEEQKDPISLRLRAIAIPVICLVGEIIKIAFDVKQALYIGYRSIKSLSFRTGNCRIGVTHACEHVRNIAGITFGIFVALYSPLAAKELFLTPKAEINLQKKLDPNTAATLYAVAHGVSSFFEKHGIEYRICHGSLLGAFRHQGIIPWDDDMDLMIHPNDMDKCKRLFEEGTFSKETGLSVRKQTWTGGWQCFHPDSPKGDGPLKETGLPFLDVFGTKLDSSGNHIVHDSKIMKTLFTEEHIKVDEWKKPQKYAFGPLTLTSIQNAEDYLKRRYGNEVLDFAFQVLHHDSLASFYNDPFNIISHLQKVWKYDLPRRAYLENRFPVEYNAERYGKLIQSIDANLKKDSI